jgi:sigma-B regulation protein RsbU (phosphoserine phosphatase)
LLYEASTTNRYATFFYAQYEAAARRLTYVNAGHNPPILLRRAAGELIRFEAGGLVVGLLRDVTYLQQTIALEYGDLLVAYTDGVSEAMNPADEEWGEEKLIETIQACDGLSARDTLARIMAAADQFAAGAKQHDDMTLTVMRVVPEVAA